MFKKTLISLVISLGLTTVVVANEELKKRYGETFSYINTSSIWISF